jgi:TetR/AcrR family transcriptional repressor of nem operon
MARPRSFDPDEALDLARDVFWQKGFQGASLDDITAATGLNKRASMRRSATRMRCS